MSETGQTLRFRHPGTVTVAAVIAGIATLPMLGASPWFALLLVVPLALAVWGWRTGTDVDADGLRVRAALGSRKVRWPDVAELAAGPGGTVSARLTSGGVLRLPAVPATELSRIVAASGRTVEVAADQ